MLINMIYLVVVLMFIFKNHAILYKAVYCFALYVLISHAFTVKEDISSAEIMNDCVWSRVEPCGISKEA